MLLLAEKEAAAAGNLWLSLLRASRRLDFKRVAKSGPQNATAAIKLANSFTFQPFQNNNSIGAHKITFGPPEIA